MHDHHGTPTGVLEILASLLLAGRELVRVLYQGAPSWSVVPPLLLAGAAIWNARTNARKARASESERAALLALIAAQVAAKTEPTPR